MLYVLNPVLYLRYASSLPIAWQQNNSLFVGRKICLIFSTIFSVNDVWSQVYLVDYWCILFCCKYSMTQKSKPLPNYQKSHCRIKANETRFIPQVKLSIKHYNTIRW